MRDSLKYRLKKDTPAFRSGYIFETDPKDEGILLDEEGVSAFYKNEIDNFDEWFEEVKEPTWVRKQIKQIEFGEHKSVYVVVRFVKSQNYIGYDNELGDVVASNEHGEVKKIWFNANESEFWRQKDYDTLNQMVRDGYIEIEDNPNIVWEDYVN